MHFTSFPPQCVTGTHRVVHYELMSQLQQGAKLQHGNTPKLPIGSSESTNLLNYHHHKALQPLLSSSFGRKSRSGFSTSIREHGPSSSTQETKLMEQLRRENVAEATKNTFSCDSLPMRQTTECPESPQFHKIQRQRARLTTRLFSTTDTRSSCLISYTVVPCLLACGQENDSQADSQAGATVTH